MVIDTKLLKRAEEANTASTEAERAALLARADYHAAVRRLHLAGASLREIAQALGVSHQRVQQIVSAAGGTWWQKMWRTRRPARDAVCTFCDRPPREVEKLVAGPDVYICDACITRAERAISMPRARAGLTVSQTGRAKCSFCGKKPTADRPIVATPSATVCAHCLRTCREIVDASASST